MKFTVTIDRDEDGIWIAECPSIPGCVSQGRTEQEALRVAAAWADATQDYIKHGRHF